MEFIAEFCQNHNGDFNILTDMVYSAKDNGATYAKVQHIYSDMLSFREKFEPGMTNSSTKKTLIRPYKNEYERLKKLELSIREQSDFINLCNKVSIKPLTTIFSTNSLSEILELGYKDIKIASYDCGSENLINSVIDNFDKIIISTGATYDDEIEKTSLQLKKSNFTFLHCVTLYPTPLQEYHLNRMNYLRKFTSSVGWSDHSLVEKDGIKGTLASIFYGADVVERHFTILPSEQTKDGPVSIKPEHLNEIVEFAKLDKEEQEKHLNDIFPEYSICLGLQQRKLTQNELANRDYYKGRFI